MPITSSCCIGRRTLSLLPACFMASRLFFHSIGRRRACPLPALRLAGRGVSSSRSAVFSYLIEYAMRLRLFACRRLGRCQCFLISSCGAVLRVLLVSLLARLCRLISSASHLIGHRLACRLPALRHGWAGREAGSVGVLLAWFLPCGLCRCR